MNDAENFKSFTILFAILMIPVSLVLEWRRRKRDPSGLRFAWGYWQGLTASSGIIITLLFLLGDAPHSEEGYLLAIFFFSLGLVGVFMLKRQKWAWIIGTILTFNPLMWIINWFYIRKRWTQTLRRRLPTMKIDEPDRQKPKMAVGAAAPPEVCIYLSRGEQQSGPFVQAQIRSMWANGVVTADTLYWYEGLADWQPIQEIV